MPEADQVQEAGLLKRDRIVQSWWLWVIFGLLAITTFTFGGFLVPTQPFLLGLVALALFVFCVRFREGKIQKLTLLDLIVFALAILYVMSIAWAVNRRYALGEALKQVACVGIFWMASRTVRNERDQSLLVRGLVGLTGVVAVGSIVLASGWLFHYPDALQPNPFRLAGPFQYANALAAICLAGFAAVLPLRAATEDWRWRSLWSAVAYANLISLVVTYSRTTYLLVPIVLVALLVFSPKGLKLGVVLGVIVALFGAGAVLLPLDAAVRSGAGGVLPLWFLLGLLVTVVVDMGMTWARRRPALFRAVLIGLGVALAAAVVLFLPRATFLVNRLSSVSVSDDSVMLRFWTWSDAIRAWSHENPVLGMGGGGWRSVYLNYRRIDFISKFVHSSVLETLTELGVLGVVLLLGSWLFGLRSAWKAMKRESSLYGKALWVGAGVGLAALLVHSAADFDLSFPALMLWVYAMLGALRGSEMGSDPIESSSEHGKKRPVQHGGIRQASLRPIIGVVAVAGTVVGLLLGLGSEFEFKGETAIARGDWNTAESMLGTSAMLDPWNDVVQLQYGLSLIQVGGAQKSDTMQSEGLRHMQLAMKLDTHNPDTILTYTDTVRSAMPGDELFNLLCQAFRLDPYNTKAYGRAVDQANVLIAQALSQQNVALAKVYIRQVGSIFETFDANRRSGHDPNRFVMQDDNRMKVQRAMYLAYSNHVPEAVQILEQVRQDPDVVVQKAALMWLSAINLQQGKQAQAQALQAELAKLDSSLANNVQYVARDLGLALQGS